MNIQEISDYLQGTCATIEEVITQFQLDPLTDEKELALQINEHGVYLCTSCGLWHAKDDMFSPDTCRICYEEDLA